jgi:hypothetical protein
MLVGCGSTPDVKSVYQKGDWTEAIFPVHERNLTYYFNNDQSRLCFTFKLPGIWYPTGESGLLSNTMGGRHPNTWGPAGSGHGHAGALVVSKSDLTIATGSSQIVFMQRYIEHLIASFDDMFGVAIEDSNVTDFSSKYPGSVKWVGRWPATKAGVIPQVTRYIAPVSDGWLAAVTASPYGRGPDDTFARALLASLEITKEAGCYSQRMQELIQDNAQYNLVTFAGSPSRLTH